MMKSTLILFCSSNVPKTATVMDKIYSNSKSGVKYICINFDDKSLVDNQANAKLTFNKCKFSHMKMCRWSKIWNRIKQYVEGDYVVFSYGDVVPPDNWYQSIITCIEKDAPMVIGGGNKGDKYPCANDMVQGDFFAVKVELIEKSTGTSCPIEQLRIHFSKLAKQANGKIISCFHVKGKTSLKGIGICEKDKAHAVATSQQTTRPSKDKETIECQFVPFPIPNKDKVSSIPKALWVYNDQKSSLIAKYRIIAPAIGIMQHVSNTIENFYCSETVFCSKQLKDFDVYVFSNPNVPAEEIKDIKNNGGKVYIDITTDEDIQEFWATDKARMLLTFADGIFYDRIAIDDIDICQKNKHSLKDKFFKIQSYPDFTLHDVLNEGIYFSKTALDIDSYVDDYNNEKLNIASEKTFKLPEKPENYYDDVNILFLETTTEDAEFIKKIMQLSNKNIQTNIGIILHNSPLNILRTFDLLERDIVPLISSEVNMNTQLSLLQAQKDSIRSWKIKINRLNTVEKRKSILGKLRRQTDYTIDEYVKRYEKISHCVHR